LITFASNRIKETLFMDESRKVMRECEVRDSLLEESLKIHCDFFSWRGSERERTGKG
jgi:hypothetical protein